MARDPRRRLNTRLSLGEPMFSWKRQPNFGAIISIARVLKTRRSAGLAACTSLLIVVGVARSADLGPSDWPTKGWSVAAPEAEGLDSGALADVVEWAKAERVDSLLVVRHGKIVLDSYYAPFKPGIRHNLFSATKSFVGTLIAITIRDHFLDSVDHPVLDFFQDKAVAHVDDRKKAITVQHLLDMTSGFEWDRSSYAMFGSSDPTKFVLDQPMKTEPGQSFYYNNGNPYILSALITKLAGQNALDFAKKELFEPLGITDVDWGKPDAQNVINGQSHLFLLPQDMAKLGYLYLHNGEWDGKQIIPASWVERARAGVINDEYGLRYANLWWSLPGGGAYFARGARDQLIIVVPDSDIVAVLTAALPNGTISPSDLVDYIIKCVRADKDLPPDPKGDSRLDSALKSAATERRDPVEQPSPLAQEISGKSYDFDDNALRLKTLSLNLVGPDPTWSASWERSATDKTIEFRSRPIGLNGVFPEGPSQEGIPIVKGRWLSATSFEAKSRVLGSGVTNTWKFEFRPATIDVHFENDDGFIGDAHGTMRQ
jgi:CubicO group peptidase (beta-lactamase class C family)